MLIATIMAILIVRGFKQKPNKFYKHFGLAYPPLVGSYILVSQLRLNTWHQGKKKEKRKARIKYFKDEMNVEIYVLEGRRLINMIFPHAKKSC